MSSSEAISATTDGRPFDDGRLETLLVHLVGRLEQQMISLEPTDSVKRMIREIDVSLAMLVTIIDTGIANYDVNFFGNELPSVWRLRERSKVVLDRLDNELWTSGFGLSPKATASLLAVHRDLGKNFAHMFRDLFARFGEEFQSQALRDEFRESCAVFVEDFTQRW